MGCRRDQLHGFDWHVSVFIVMWFEAEAYCERYALLYVFFHSRHPFDKYADMSDEEMKDLILKFGEDGCNQTLLDEVAFDERVHGL